MRHTLRGGNKEADKLTNAAMNEGMGKRSYTAYAGPNFLVSSNASTTPEPSSLLLLTSGLLGLGGMIKRRLRS
jgi:hypothetical protein